MNKRKCNCVLLKSNILSTTIAGDDNNILSFLSFDNNRGSSSVDDHVSAVGKIIEGPRFNDGFSHFFGNCHGIICLTF